MIQARPTFYSGIKFRSRLEATWACFFDLCGWTWVYEPMDLKGWVPDFELHTQNGRRLLVEVKPENFNCFNAYSVEESVYSKAVNHVEHYDLMLLGVSPFRKDNYHCIGILVYMEDSVQNGKELMIDYAGFKLDGRGYGLSPILFLWDNWVGNTDRKRFCRDDDKTVYSIFNNAIDTTKKVYR